MVLETDPIVFVNWLIGTTGAIGFIPAFLLMVGGTAVLALLLGYIYSAVQYGPMRGGDVTYQTVKAGALDLFQASPRRIWALARLAMQESIRRRVWIALVLFAVILGFAGWFLDPNSFDPGRLYLGFVINATTVLILTVALFISVFSLPADIKNHTIYTIVTKPVRRGEIVLGRMLGFGLIGTGLLAVMALSNYVFVVRGISHTHEIETDSLQESGAGVRSGRTMSAQGHRHDVTLGADGNGNTDIRNGHWHEITAHGAKSVLGPPQGVFMARVPLYGTMKFKDRLGKPGQGISVGKEWSYRKFIEGGSLSAAVWTFENVTKEQFPDGLPLEMTIRVFRSWKGKMDEGILGSLVVRNPKTGRTSAIDTFHAKDDQIDHKDIPLKLRDGANPKGPPLDLFADLVSPDGTVEIILQCLDSAQYFGVAKADLYLRASDASFEMNFIKGHLGIWFQLLLVTALGVLFSTFLSGPVAMLATISAIVLGFFSKFIADLVTGAAVGGGPIESFIRLIKQDNMVTPMDEGLTRTVVQTFDKVVLTMMHGAGYLLPDFRQFSNIDYLAYGFNISSDTVLRQLCLTAAYTVSAAIIGTFILKSREVAR